MFCHAPAGSSVVAVAEVLGPSLVEGSVVTALTAVLELPTPSSSLELHPASAATSAITTAHLVERFMAHLLGSCSRF